MSGEEKYLKREIEACLSRVEVRFSALSRVFQAIFY
jgi:hypothetical protein